MTNNDKCLTLYDVLILWIVAVSLSSVALLTLHQFKSFYALTFGTILSVCIVAFVYRGSIQFRIPKEVIWVIVILMVAIIFRAQPFLWVMGGQDQGLYVNMSEHYEKYGTPFIKDNVRAKLSNEAKVVYDKTQHYLDSFQGNKSYPTVDIEGMKKKGVYNENVKHNNVYAMHTPAVFLKDMANSEYVFQFYPLHPLWMSIFSKMFGRDNRVYSTVIFSLLSIVSFYLLALELSGGRRIAGIFVAGMIACNPLHAFFSKFPATEIPTLFFSATGFYYLARYYNRSLQLIYRTDYLILSALLLFCMFFTRITGFLYMPVFYFILLSVVWGEVRGKRRASHLIYYSIAIMVLYTISVMYGLQYSYPYSMNTYKGIFQLIFGTSWLGVVTGLILSAIASVGMIYLLRDNISINKYINYQNIVNSFKYLLCSVVGIAIIRVLILLHEQGIKQLFSYTLIAIVVYICPFSFVYLYNSVKENSCAIKPFHAVLLALWLFFFTTTLLTAPVVRYQYYYARYLLSEIVPYALLLVAIYWSAIWVKGKGSKMLVKAVFGLTCIYFSFFSLFQLQGVEADGAAQALQVVKNNIKESDVLVLGFDDLRLQTSLSYYYDINTYRVDRPQSVNDTIFPELKSKFSKLYLLAKSPVNSQSIRLVSEINYREGQYEHVNRIPMKFNYINQCTLYLYEIDKKMDNKSVYTMIESNRIWPGKS
jgi:hypothetical protein